jgi:hypothetical protein
MPRMRLCRPFSALFCLLAVVILPPGCGGSGSSGSSSGAVESRPAPARNKFPSASGKTLAEVVESAEGPSEFVISPAAEVFYVGKDRYPFAVFQRDHTQVTNAEVALYLAKVQPGAGGNRPQPSTSKPAAKTKPSKAFALPAIGPFTAGIETLATKPAFRARTTTDDPNAATAVYYANVDFPSNGEWRVVALIRQGGKTTAKLISNAVVGEFTKVPRAGRRAPLIHTPTTTSVHGDLSKITTRIPPDTQNRVDYAVVLGKEPIVLLFATPEFCQSRVCGPVVDVAEQVKKTYGNRVAFIHMEIYNDNDPSKGVRPQVRAFHLPSEPWLFAINRRGRIQTAVEGAFGVDALTRIVKGLVGG